jgi:phage/plasmid-associated DNA primase
LTEYFSELTPVRRWIKDEGLEMEDFIGQPASEMYSKFKGWANLTGEGDNISQRIFNSEVKNLFSLRVEPMWKNGKTQRCFVSECDNALKTLTMFQFFRKVLGKVSVRIPVRNWNIRLNIVKCMCQILTMFRKEMTLS